jgi:hypothetical protein
VPSPPHWPIANTPPISRRKSGFWRCPVAKGIEAKQVNVEILMLPPSELLGRNGRPQNVEQLLAGGHPDIADTLSKIS